MIQDAVPADSIRRVLAEVFAAAPYRWRDESEPTLWLRRWWRALTEWLGRLAGDHPVLFQLLIWTLIALLVAIALHTVWVLVRTTRARSAVPGLAAAGAAEIRDIFWYAREAERLRAKGRYAAAIQADFVRLALELDARDIIRFHPSKTPREYLADLPRDDVRRSELAELVGELYRYAFAGFPCGPDEFAAWRSRTSLDRYAPTS